jgi:hypothetical protein
MASATKSELTALFHNTRDAAPLRTALKMKWDIHKVPHPSKPTMHALSVSPMKQLSNTDPKQSTCIFTGSATESNKDNNL